MAARAGLLVLYQGPFDRVSDFFPGEGLFGSVRGLLAAWCDRPCFYVSRHVCDLEINTLGNDTEYSQSSGGQLTRGKAKAAPPLTEETRQSCLQAAGSPDYTTEQNPCGSVIRTYIPLKKYKNRYDRRLLVHAGDVKGIWILGRRAQLAFVREDSPILRVLATNGPFS